MNASEMTFGIEIECCLPMRARIEVGGYHRGVAVAGLPAGWNAQADGSIAPPMGYYGVEIVSPVLQGSEGLRQVVAVCCWLKTLGALVNRSTGLHVHVGFPAVCRPRLQHLVHTVSNFEEAIYASTGTHSRERGHYCRSVRRNFQGADLAGGQISGPTRDRYHVLNVSNLVSGYKPTVEFRAFAGTINARKIVAYVRMCLGLVERALSDKKPPKWEGQRPAGRSPMLRKTGNGYTQLTRLLYHLGWVKGRTSYTFGNVTGEGLPSIEECKAELRRLARKYDRQPD